MKRVLLVSLFVAMVLTLLLPSMALAAKPVSLNCSGIISHITDSYAEGTRVIPAGNSGQWRVVTRDILGTFVAGPLAGANFVLNYRGVVDFPDQQGNIHGRLSCGDNIFSINGKSEGAVFFDFVPNIPEYGPLAGAPLYELAITGHWTCLQGDWGTGDFAASVKFVPTPDGHIAWVNPYLSTFTMLSQ